MNTMIDLYFFFLGEKLPVSNKSLDKLHKKIGERFSFKPEIDIYDFRDIYRMHVFLQDLPRLQSVVNIIDDAIVELPFRKIRDINAVCVSFHEEQKNNAFQVIDILLKEGVSVYINSKEIYSEFRDLKHTMFDYLSLADKSTNLSHISFCVLLLSPSFITRIVNNSEHLCFLFKYAMENEIKVESISFQRFLRGLEQIKNPDIKIFSDISSESAPESIKHMLKRNDDDSMNEIGIEDIETELCSIDQSFTCIRNKEVKNFYWLKLSMIGQEDIELNYLIIRKGYVLRDLKPDVDKLQDTTVYKNLNILVPNINGQKKKGRLENIRSLFPLAKVHYISEFFYDRRYKAFNQTKMLNNSEFVDPIFRTEGQECSINHIVYWVLNHSESSVAIVHGSGGIGKTTICEKAHDIILDNYNRIIIIFITAEMYIEVFGKFGRETEYDLYRIFSLCHKLGSRIDVNSFYLNYALGNIVFIFDGIDEVVSTISDFTLGAFLDSLETVRLKVGRGKVIINCRDSYVSDLKKYFSQEQVQRFKFFELLAFNENRAKEFFYIHFKDDLKVQKCMHIANELYSAEDKSNKFKFPPFVLEVVAQISGSDFDFSMTGMEIDTTLLQKCDNLDFVVFQVCNREYFKKEKHGFQLSVNDQLRFFCALSIEADSVFSELRLGRILEFIGIFDRTDEVVKGLVDHPFLAHKDDQYYFRFDFLKVYFKSLVIFNLMCKKTDFTVTENLIEVISSDCNYNSVLSKTLVERANRCDIPFQECLQFSKVLLASFFKVFSIDSRKSYRVKKAISNLVVVILKSERPQRFTCTEVFNFLFSYETNQIHGLFLIDIPYSSNLGVNFDNLIVSDSEISNFFDFFNCSFNDDTFFDDTCVISNVYDYKVDLKGIKASIKNFDKNIKGDNSIFRALSMKTGGVREIKRIFKEFFRPAYRGREFVSEIPSTSIVLPKDDIATVELISEILIKNSIVLKVDSGWVFFNMSFSSKIISFIGQGLVFKQLSNSMSDLQKVFSEY